MYYRNQENLESLMEGLAEVEGVYEEEIGLLTERGS